MIFCERGRGTRDKARGRERKRRREKSCGKCLTPGRRCGEILSGRICGNASRCIWIRTTTSDPTVAVRGERGMREGWRVSPSRVPTGSTSRGSGDAYIRRITGHVDDLTGTRRNSSSCGLGRGMRINTGICHRCLADRAIARDSRRAGPLAQVLSRAGDEGGERVRRFRDEFRESGSLLGFPFWMGPLAESYRRAWKLVAAPPARFAFGEIPESIKCPSSPHRALPLD
jgi:hypothetical protein